MPAEVSPKPEIFVHLLPSLIRPGALRGGIAVVVDVLRASTAIIQALDSGIESIIPCLEVDDALRAASSMPRGKVVLGGERQGVPIEGFDFGNSPSSYSPEVCRGKTLVLTTTNGTRAILASLDAERIFVGAFTNAKATIRATREAAEDRPIHLVCSGTDGRVSLEDSLLCGYLATMLNQDGRGLANDEAQIVSRSWQDVLVGDDHDRLGSVLRLGRGGKRVTELGYAPDIDSAATVGRFDFAAEFLRDREPHRIVRI